MREFPLRGELHALLVGGSPTALGPNGQDPHFELGHNLKKVELAENAKISYTIDSSFTAKLNNDVKFEQVELWFYGDSETSGQIFSESFKKTAAPILEKTEQKQEKNIATPFEIVNVVSEHEKWSIYKLMDETILKIRVSLIKALRQNRFDLNENPVYELNTQPIIGVVSSKTIWGTPSQPFTQQELQSSIVQRDLKFETLEEPWNYYVLSDGTKLQITTALTSVSKTAKYSSNGEPIYIVNWASNTKIEAPDSLKKKLEQVKE